MNTKIKVGKDKNGEEIILDLQKENLHSIILTGTTGSGKGIFHANLYKQLIEQNSPKEFGFVFFDMTMVDFVGWKTPYLYLPTITYPLDVLTPFEMLGNESILRSQNKSSSKRAIVIHIEECDMMLEPERFEKVWLNITKNKNKNNMYIIFSTSRPSPDIFTKTILDNTDLKVIFNLSSLIDSNVVLGKSGAEKLTQPGEKILVYKDKEIYSLPFTEEQLKEIVKFDEEMSSNEKK